MARASEAERRLVLAEGVKHGFPEAELDAVIALESGWDPAAMNPTSKAVGLIQFMPRTLLTLGFTGGPDAFRQVSAADQAPYVGRFLRATAGRWHTAGDTYLAVFAPAFIGASDDTELYPVGTKAWQQNPGLRGKDGRITAGSVRYILQKRMAGGSMPLPKVSRAALGSDWLPLVAAFGAVYAIGKWLAKRKRQR